MTTQQDMQEEIRKDRDCESNKVQGWIKTLWPIVTVVIALFMAYQSLESRVTALEMVTADMKEAIYAMQVEQGQTNVELGILNTNIDNLNISVTRIVNILDTEY